MLKDSNLTKSISKISSFVKNSLKKFNERISIVSFCLLILLIISSIQIIYEIQLSPRTYNYTNVIGNIPITDTQNSPFSERSVGGYFVIFPGQYAIINFSTTVRTTLKVIPVNYTSNTKFSTETPFMNSNSTNHFFIIHPPNNQSLYLLYLKGLEDAYWLYEGQISIYGIDQNTIFVPIMLGALSILILIGRLLINLLLKSLKSFKNPLHSQEKYNKLNKLIKPYFSFFNRINLIMQILRKETGILRIVIAAIVIWNVIQPIFFLRFRFDPREDSLVGSFSPQIYSILLLACLIILECSEVISGRRMRKDLMVIFSLPFKRFEWIIGGFLWIFSIYGGVFTLTFFIKVFILNSQLNLEYNLLLIICWLIFFLFTLGAWTITGLYASTTSITRVTSSLKGLIIIVIVSFLMLIMDGGGDLSKGNGYGILNLKSIARSPWLSTSPMLSTSPFNGLVQNLTPNLEKLFISINISVLWFLIGLLATFVRIRTYEDF